MAAWCRGFAVEIASPWTALLLKRLGRFQSSVESFYLRSNGSAQLEKSGEQFLFKMSADRDPLVSSMARLELALMRMMQGSADEYLVEWDRNPEPVFLALRSGREFPAAEPGVRYRTLISRDIVGLVRCEREELASL